ncbi:MAG: DUF58 domain-containing protein [Thermocladium sp.]
MNPIRLLTLTRKVLPLIYIALNLGHPIIYAYAVPLLIIELIFRSGRDAALAMLHMGALILSPWPISLALSLILVPVLDASIKSCNLGPWWIYATPLLASSLLSLALLGPGPALSLIIITTYIVAAAFLTWIRFETLHITLSTNGEVRAVAGEWRTYFLRLSSVPKSSMRVIIEPPKQIKLERNTVSLGGDVIKAMAFYSLGGVKVPLMRLRLIDERGLISASRVIKHPPIVVKSRTQQAIELGRELLSTASAGGAGDIIEVREYVPGDPIKRIHWKKSLKLDKYVIKLMESESNFTLAVLAYASSEVIADKLGAAAAFLLAQALKRGGAELAIIDRNNSVIKRLIDPSDYEEAVNELVKAIRVLGVKPRRWVDNAGLLRRLIPRTLPIEPNGSRIVLIGEDAWVRALCPGSNLCIKIS